MLRSLTHKPYRRTKLLRAGELGKKFVKLVKSGPEQCRRRQRHDPSQDHVAGHVPTHGGGLAGGAYADNGARDRVGRGHRDTEVRDKKQRHCTPSLGAEALHVTSGPALRTAVPAIAQNRSCSASASDSSLCCSG